MSCDLLDTTTPALFCCPDTVGKKVQLTLLWYGFLPYSKPGQQYDQCTIGTVYLFLTNNFHDFENNISTQAVVSIDRNTGDTSTSGDYNDFFGYLSSGRYQITESFSSPSDSGYLTRSLIARLTSNGSIAATSSYIYSGSVVPSFDDFDQSQLSEFFTESGQVKGNEKTMLFDDHPDNGQTNWTGVNGVITRTARGLQSGPTTAYRSIFTGFGFVGINALFIKSEKVFPGSSQIACQYDSDVICQDAQNLGPVHGDGTINKSQISVSGVKRIYPDMSLTRWGHQTQIILGVCQ